MLWSGYNNELHINYMHHIIGIIILLIYTYIHNINIVPDNDVGRTTRIHRVRYSVKVQSKNVPPSKVESRAVKEGEVDILKSFSLN